IAESARDWLVALAPYLANASGRLRRSMTALQVPGGDEPHDTEPGPCIPEESARSPRLSPKRRCDLAHATRFEIEPGRPARSRCDGLQGTVRPCLLESPVLV